MKQMNELLRNYDLDYYGTGSHKISLEEMVDLLQKDELILLDVRTYEEAKWVMFPAAVHIPLDELSERFNELPKDKMIAPFCSGGTRSTTAAVYLEMMGFESVRAITDSTADLAAKFTPGYVRKLSLNKAD